jgi:regulator of RNase E activity RraA
MTGWSTDDELFSLAERQLFTCVVGDIMDKLHLFHQFLPPRISPIDQDAFLIGRAMPVLCGDVFQESSTNPANRLMAQPFGLMLEAVDDLKRNEVYICTGSSPRNANWGEMMATRATKLGARGAVLDGYYRDTKGLLRMKFPTFGYGAYGQDSAPRYKVHDFRVSIEIGAVRVNPGDIVMGDIDGVCIIPKEAEREVFIRSLEKARGEKLVKKALETGITAVAAYREHGIM